jgi:hypothetical protein
VLYDLGMMLNPGSFDIPWVLIFALAIIGLLVGEAWIIRIARRTDDEPADWRYRKDTKAGRRARFRRTSDGSMKPDKAPGYWPTRFLLAVAIIGTVAVAFAGWSLYLEPFTIGGGRPRLLGLPSNVVLSVLAAVTAVIGLIWTIRIFRGPHDEPPRWRYRNR